MPTSNLCNSEPYRPKADYKHTLPQGGIAAGTCGKLFTPVIVV